MKNDDVQLIRNILAGDENAFVSLVEKYQKQVHALAWRKIGDFHIAEEITQDTFLKVYQKLPTLRNPNHFSGWLYVIANRQCLAWLRKKRIETESLDNTDTKWIDEDSYSRYISEEHAKVTTETQQDVVKKLLAKLKESERTVLTLHYFAEMTVEEISRFLGVSTSAIKLRLYRARQRLQKEEQMIREALSNFQLSPNLSENIMKKVKRIKPGVPSGSKPFIPWVIGASTVLLIVLMLGMGSQYLARFQKPYNLDATAEMTVDILNAPIVANLDIKPIVRTQDGNVKVQEKINNLEQQPNNATAPTAEAQGDEIVEDYTKWELPKKAKARFGKGGINVLQFSPDGRQLAVGSSIGVWLYDVETGKELSMFSGPCKSIAFSPDGRFLANQGHQLWEVTTGRKIELVDNFPIASVLRFSEDGKALFALSGEGKSINQLDVETGKGNVKHIEGQTNWDYKALFALTHDKFAVGTETKIELWDTTNSEVMSTLNGNIYFLALEFSPDGTRLASAGRSSDTIVTIQLWDTDSKESIILDKHTGWVHTLAFSPDGKILASGGGDKTVQLWDATTGKPLTTLLGHTNGITALTFSPDNRTLASGSTDGTVQFWNIKTGNSLPTRITEHTMQVETATFFRDNTTLATVAHDGVVSLWDVKTPQKIDTNTLQKTDFYHKGDQDREYQDWLLAAAFSPDGTKIVSAAVKGNRAFSGSVRREYTADQLIRLSDVKTGHELQTLVTAESPSSVTFSSDGKTVAFHVYGKIRVWNTETDKTFDISLDTSHLDQDEINKLPHHIQTQISALESEISTLVFSPDGKKLVGATRVGKVEMWDAKTGVWLASLFERKDPIVEGTPPNISIASQEYIPTLAFSPNGNLIAINLVAISSSTEQIYLLKGHEHILLMERSFTTAALVFSLDNALLVTGLHDGSIELWDTETGNKLTTLEGHTLPVQTLVFSPDGKTLVSTGQDGTILVWDWDDIR